MTASSGHIRGLIGSSITGCYSSRPVELIKAKQISEISHAVIISEKPRGSRGGGFSNFSLMRSLSSAQLPSRFSAAPSGKVSFHFNVYLELCYYHYHCSRKLVALRVYLDYCAHTLCLAYVREDTIYKEADNTDGLRPLPGTKKGVTTPVVDALSISMFIVQFSNELSQS